VRQDGRIGGRPPKLKAHQQKEIVNLVKKGRRPPPHVYWVSIRLPSRDCCSVNDGVSKSGGPLPYSRQIL
jgi:hypothetical protein